MMAVLTGITDGCVTRLTQCAPKAEELRRLPAATVAELDESGFTALLKPAVLTHCAGAVCVGLVSADVMGCARRYWVSRTPRALCLASDGAADVAMLVSGPEIRGAI
jgi:hypothetical protein